MGLIQWARDAVDRIGTNIEVLRNDLEIDALMEDDPIGDFLSRKEAGTLQLEEQEALAEMESGSEPQEPEGQLEESVGAESELTVVNLLAEIDEQEVIAETVEAEALLDESEESVVRVEPEGVEAEPVAMEEPQAVDEAQVNSEKTTGDIPQPPEAANLASAGTVAVEDDQEVVKAEINKVKPTDSQPAKESQEGDEIDELLDVFKNESLTENPISLLSQDLSDVSVGSLLEETKSIAEEFKKML